MITKRNRIQIWLLCVVVLQAIICGGQTFTTLHSFSWGSDDGAFPFAGLTLSGNTLYGTTDGGGEFDGGGGNTAWGTVFSLSINGSDFTNLHSFTYIDIKPDDTTNSDGAYPVSGVILSGNTLYGSASAGGTYGLGTVFALNTNGSGFKTLCSFNDGTGGISILSGSTLYGSTGGDGSWGAVFAVNTDGTSFTTLYSFTNGSDGIDGVVSILSGSTLYGTAYDGASSENGKIFSINTNGTCFTTLYDFTNGNDGGFPNGGLLLSGNTLYGTTEGNSIFAVNTNGTGFTTVHIFNGSIDGGNPAGLILSNNTLYGTAHLGGSYGNGTVFAVNINGTGFTTLHSFGALIQVSFGVQVYTNSDGAYPDDRLILSGKTLYGTALEGGSGSLGTVFALPALAIPAITWSQPAAITYGTALSSNQLNATASVSGAFVYTPIFNTVLNAGTNTLIVVFTPADTNDYFSVTNSVSLVVSPAPLTVTASPQSKTYGQTLIFSTGSTNFTSVGLQNGDTIGSVTLTVSGNGGASNAPVSGSPYTITPTNVTGGTFNINNYNITYVPNTLTVNLAALSITASSEIKPYGQTEIFPASSTNFTSIGLENGDTIGSVTLTVNSNGGAVTAPIGYYSITSSMAMGGTFNAPNYAISYYTGTLTVTPTAETFTWTNPAPIVYGTPLTSNQLDATAGVSGAFVYTPTTNAVLNAGTNLLAVVFTPADTNDYISVTDSVSLGVLTAPLTVTADNTNRIFGQTNPIFSGTVTGLTNGDSITATYDCSATNNSPPGIYPIEPTLVDPNNRLSNYSVATNNGTLTVAATNTGGTTCANTVAYYRFEEGTNGYSPLGVNTILDSSGNGLNGTPFGGMFYSSNVAATPIPLTCAPNLLSLDFDGSSGRVFIPDYPQLELTNSLTIEAFINAASPGGGPYDFGQICFRGDDRGGWDPYFLALAGTNLVFEVTDSNNIASVVQAPIILNTWHHVAATLDNSTGEESLYIDGILVAQTTTFRRPFGPLIGPNPGLGIGNVQSTVDAEYFNGLIDEVRISDTALSPSQFLNAGMCPQPPVIIAQPTNQTVTSGKSVSFTVSATGAGPLSYQWQFVGTNLTDNALVAGSQSNVLTISGVTMSNAGTYEVLVSNSYGSTNASAILTVSQAIPIIEWTNPSPITYGTPLSSAQLNATANVPGSFGYNPPNGTVLPDGINTLSVIFTPTDTVDYSSVTNTVSLLVLPANNGCLPPPSGLINWWPGNGNAIDIIGGNNGVLEGGVTYTNGEVSQAFNFDGTDGFISTTTQVNNPQTFSLSLWFKTVSTQGGGLLGFGDTQTGNSDNYDRNLYMDDSGSIHFGVWTGSAQLVNSAAGYNDNNWHAVVASLSASTGLSLYLDGVLAENNPGVTSAQNYNGWWRIGEVTLGDSGQPWPDQPSSFYLNGQIDEAAIFNRALSTSEVQAIYYSGSAGMCSQPVIIAQPTNQIVTAGNSVIFTVSATGAGPLSYQWLFNGTNLTDNSQFTGSQSNDLILSSVTMSNAGTYEVLVSNSYGSTNASSILTVSQAIPIISWTNASPVSFGAPLSSNQLNATANVPGTFVYIPTNGTVLNAGSNMLSVVFTPTDTVDYISVTNTVSLLVVASFSTVQYEIQADIDGRDWLIIQGQTVQWEHFDYTPVGLHNPNYPATIISSSEDGLILMNDVSWVPSWPNGTGSGAFSSLYEGLTPTLPLDPASVALNVVSGRGPVTIIQLPTDTNNNVLIVEFNDDAYPSDFVYDVQINMAGIATLVTWTTPAPIIYGTALSSNQLNATANVPGSFTYTPPIGSILNIGTNTLSVIFTPTDTVDYSSVTDSVSLVVTAPASPVFQAVQQTGSSFAFTWNSISNLMYQIQATASFSPPNWTNLGSPITASNSTMTNSQVIGTNRQQFYRVVLEP